MLGKMLRRLFCKLNRHEFEFQNDAVTPKLVPRRRGLGGWEAKLPVELLSCELHKCKYCNASILRNKKGSRALDD